MTAGQVDPDQPRVASEVVGLENERVVGQLRDAQLCGGAPVMPALAAGRRVVDVNFSRPGAAVIVVVIGDDRVSAGAKHLTNSPSPIQAESGKENHTQPEIELHTQRVTESTMA